MVQLQIHHSLTPRVVVRPVRHELLVRQGSHPMALREKAPGRPPLDESALLDHVQLDGRCVGQRLLPLRLGHFPPIEHLELQQAAEHVEPIALELADSVVGEVEDDQIGRVLAQGREILRPVEEVVVDLQGCESRKRLQVVQPADQVETEIERLEGHEGFQSFDFGDLVEAQDQRLEVDQPRQVLELLDRVAVQVEVFDV
mmetsp:Transcript_14381/g.49122  ORF Transcript_14381/g.49122 Transcript_14381/m.49122 type:complete len:200 (-) Transcript_14381:1342-1941(-)